MRGFDEQDLLAKGLSEQQVAIIGTIALTKNVDFDRVEFIETKLVTYKYYHPCADATIVVKEGIDSRIPSLIKKTLLLANTPEPFYVRAHFTADFKECTSYQDLLSDLLPPTRSSKPFASGIINHDNHHEKNLETITQEKNLPLTDTAHPRKKYHLPPTEQPFIALYFSVHAIGDTVIEIRRKLSR